MDLQSIGILVARLRKERDELKRENAELRQMVEDIICSPGTWEYETGKGHPLKDGPTQNGETK